jgi:hypothetical protein
MFFQPLNTLVFIYSSSKGHYFQRLSSVIPIFIRMHKILIKFLDTWKMESKYDDFSRREGSFFQLAKNRFVRHLLKKIPKNDDL